MGNRKIVFLGGLVLSLAVAATGAVLERSAGGRVYEKIVVQNLTTDKMAADWLAMVAGSPRPRARCILKRDLAAVDLLNQAGELLWLLDGKRSGLLVVTPDGIYDAADRGRVVE